MSLSVRGIFAALGIVALSACRGTGSADCSSKACPGGQICDLTTHLCMVAPPPGVHIDINTPKPDSVLVGTSTILAGDVLEDGNPLHSIRYSVDDGGSWTSVDAGLN